MYQGAVVVEATDGSTSVVPVTAAVTPTLEQDEDGKLTGSLTFGGADVAAAQSNLSYNNGSVFGASDWTWRAESGRLAVLLLRHRRTARSGIAAPRGHVMG